MDKPKLNDASLQNALSSAERVIRGLFITEGDRVLPVADRPEPILLTAHAQADSADGMVMARLGLIGGFSPDSDDSGNYQVVNLAGAHSGSIIDGLPDIALWYFPENTRAVTKASNAPVELSGRYFAETTTGELLPLEELKPEGYEPAASPQRPDGSF